MRAGLLSVLLPAVAAAEPCLTKVAEGWLRGTCNGRAAAGNACRAQDACTYLGVPYAAPPIAGLRWRPPQPMPGWDGVRNATDFGAACLQVPGMGTSGQVVGSESCLYLNIVAPPLERCRGASCPVMLWIHGGAYVSGSGGPLFNGSAFEQLGSDIVVVTINYRLGVLGFIGSEALRSRDPRGSTGNYGLQDQRAAMEWVGRNIHQFGGDRSNVMIFGESAGAGSVSAHLVMPRSWPLFHKAVLESGAFSYWVAQPMSSAERTFDDLTVLTGCDEQPDRVGCLEQLDAAWLVNASAVLLPKHPSPFGLQLGPTVDGVDLVGLPWDLLGQGAFHRDASVLLGFNRDEGTIYVGLPICPGTHTYAKGPNMTQADFAYLLGEGRHNLNATQVAAVLDLYKVGSPADPDYTNWYWVATHFDGDYGFSCPSRRAARAMSRRSRGRVFQYYFSHTPRAPPFWYAGLPGVPGTSGAAHGTEQIFVWQVTPSTAPGAPQHMVGSDEELLGKTMAAYWLNFAAHSDPNPAPKWPLAPMAPGTLRTSMTVHWPAYTEGQEATLKFDLPALSLEHRLLDAQCDCVDALGVLTDRVVRSALPQETPVII